MGVDAMKRFEMIGAGLLAAALASASAAAGPVGGGVPPARAQAQVLSKHGLKTPPDLSRYGFVKDEKGVYVTRTPVDKLVAKGADGKYDEKTKKEIDEIKAKHPSGVVEIVADPFELERALWRYLRDRRIEGEGTREKTEAWLRAEIKKMLPARLKKSADSLPLEGLPDLYTMLSGGGVKFEDPSVLAATADSLGRSRKELNPTGDWLDRAFDGMRTRMLPPSNNLRAASGGPDVEPGGGAVGSSGAYYGPELKFDAKRWASLPLVLQRRLLNHHLRSPGAPQHIAEMFAALKTKDDASLLHYRTEIQAMLKSSNNILRANAIYLLGRIQRHELGARFERKAPIGGLSLTPTLLAALEDPNFQVRENASMALGAIIGAYHVYGRREHRRRDGRLDRMDVFGRLFPGAKSKKGWDAFVKHAPPLIEALAKSRMRWDNGSTRWTVSTFVSYLHLMPESQRNAFVARLKDPDALVGILAGSGDHEVRELRGIHTVEGKMLFSRLEETLGGKPLSEFLKGGGVPPAEMTNLFARMTRFGILETSLEKDPKLFEVYAGVLSARRLDIGDRGKGRAMNVSDFNLAMNDLWRHDAVRMGRFVRERFRTGSGDEKKRLAAYVLFNSERFKPAFVAEARAALPPASAARVAELSRAERTPSYYSKWPEKSLRVGVVFPQEGWADRFMKHLRKNGYKRGRPRSVDGATEFPLTATIGGRKVEIRLRVLPSRLGGWAKDRSKVNEHLARFYADPDTQVVMYRGHIGDYTPGSVAAEKAKNKVFVDLGCGSKINEGVVANCSDCDYFGTTQVALGSINNTFSRSLISMLAKRRSYGDMSRLLRGAMPKSFHRYTGPYSKDAAYERALRLAMGMKENRDLRRGGGGGGEMVSAVEDVLEDDITHRIPHVPVPGRPGEFFPQRPVVLPFRR
jgi:hypothetical protein